MKFRELGNSGVKVTEITFGAWAIGGWMWGGADRKDAISAIHKSLDLGITSIDTAPVYGFGTSEEIVGEGLAGNRKEVQLLTKFGLRWDTREGAFYFKSSDNDGNDVSIHKFAGKKALFRNAKIVSEDLEPIILTYIKSTGQIKPLLLKNLWKQFMS